MKDVRVVGLARAFGTSAAVDHVYFEVPAGSLVTLLGPSGCGKTTTLRLIAGLERPDAGEVYVGGELLTSAARGVFVLARQAAHGHGLPDLRHLAAHDGLRERRLPAARPAAARGGDRRARCWRSLETARPRRASPTGRLPLLSGGQQQRVALGRALVADPDVLLLDEPFSNLDARLREEMRAELKDIQARAGITTLFVTHDQAEAMILSDRVLVMNAGRIAQDGTPRADLRGARARLRDGLPGPGRSRQRAGGAGARTAPRRAGDDGPAARRCPSRTDQTGARAKPAVLAFRSADVSFCPDAGDGRWPGASSPRCTWETASST